MLRARKGDRLVVRSRHVDEPDRDAEVLEVRNPDGSPPYRVRWSDTGHEALVFPGPDAYIGEPVATGLPKDDDPDR